MSKIQQWKNYNMNKEEERAFIANNIKICLRKLIKILEMVVVVEWWWQNLIRLVKKITLNSSRSNCLLLQEIHGFFF